MNWKFWNEKQFCIERAIIFLTKSTLVSEPEIADANTWIDADGNGFVKVGKNNKSVHQ